MVQGPKRKNRKVLAYADILNVCNHKDHRSSKHSKSQLSWSKVERMLKSSCSTNNGTTFTSLLRPCALGDMVIRHHTYSWWLKSCTEGTVVYHRIFYTFQAVFGFLANSKKLQDSHILGISIDLEGLRDCSLLAPHSLGLPSRCRADLEKPKATDPSASRTRNPRSRSHHWHSWKDPAEKQSMSLYSWKLTLALLRSLTGSYSCNPLKR